MTPTFRHFVHPEGLVSIVTACCRILLVLLKLNGVPDEPWADAIGRKQLLTCISKGLQMEYHSYLQHF